MQNVNSANISDEVFNLSPQTQEWEQTYSLPRVLAVAVVTVALWLPRMMTQNSEHSNFFYLKRSYDSN